MLRYISGRVLQGVISLLVVSIIVFFGSRLTGDPTDLLISVEAPKEEKARVKAHLGLDKPIIVQYSMFLSRAVKGDLGNSIFLNRPVAELIKMRFPATFELGITAMLISLIIALPVGVYAALRRGTPFDLVARIFAVLGQSVPSFWLGVILMLIFAVWLRILPPAGRAGPSSVILPASAAGWYLAAGIMRLTRSAMLEVLDSEYIKLARIKGLPERIVVWKHAFKNALLPVATFSVILFAGLLAGAIVIETVFAWPGLGRLLLESVVQRDFPVVQGAALFLSTIFIFANFVVDILYAYINPKIRFGR